MASDNSVNLGPATPKYETDKALLVVLESDGEKHWVPKYVIDEDSECYSMKSGSGDLIVLFDWAEKEELA